MIKNHISCVKKFSWCHNLSFRYSVLPFKLALKDLPKFPPLGKNMQPDLQDQTTNSSTCGVFYLDLPGITFMSFVLLRIFSHHSTSLQALHDLCLLVHHLFALCIQLPMLFFCFRYQFVDFPRVLLVTFRHVCTTCFLVLSSM